MTDQQPLQGPQLKGPKAPSSAMSGLDTVMQVASVPVKIFKAVVNPLAAPKVAMEILPGGASGLGSLKDSVNLLSKLGDFLKNPLKTTLGSATDAAKGGGLAGNLGKAGSAPGKAMQATGKAMEAGAGAMEAAGSGMQAGGQGLMGVGKSLQGVPIAGQIIGIPIIAAGATTRTAGVATKVAAKGVKATGKVLRGVGKVTAKVGEMAGKVLKPMLKMGKRVGKAFRAVGRARQPLTRAKNAVDGVGRAIGSMTTLTKLQDHAAKGDVASLASTTKSAASGVRQGLSQGLRGGQGGSNAAKGALSRFLGRNGPSMPLQASPKASGLPSPKGVPVSRLRATARRVVQVPRQALHRLQAGVQAMNQLARVQDQAAKGNVSGLSQSTAASVRSGSRSAALPRGFTGGNPRDVFNQLTARRAASLDYYRQARLKG